MTHSASRSTFSGITGIMSRLKEEEEQKRAGANDHILELNRGRSSALGEKRERKSGSRKASEGKTDGRITSHFQRAAPAITYRNRKKHLDTSKHAANTKTRLKKEMHRASDESDSELTKRRKTTKDEIELSDFSDDDDGMDDLLQKLEKAKEAQEKVFEFDASPKCSVEPEPTEKVETWEEIRARLRKAPTRSQLIAREKEEDDDGKDDIEFLPVGHDDGYTLDVKATKVKRLVNKHAESQGWPFLTREGITTKIENDFQSIYDKHIKPLLKPDSENDNIFYKDITKYLANSHGAHNSSVLMYLGRRMYTTGYYSELFAHALTKFMIGSGISDDFEENVKKNAALNDTIIRSGLLFHFQTAICVPEAVIRFIMDDQKVSYEEADKIRLRSAEFGMVVADKIRQDERANCISSDSENEESGDDHESESGLDSEDEDASISGLSDDD